MVWLLIIWPCAAVEKPRVFIFTDINIDSGDPDDRQSLIHLLWYSNELKIEGIVPERLNARGFEACVQAINAYEQDYTHYKLETKGYQAPIHIRNVVTSSREQMLSLFHHSAQQAGEPLYVLIWGNMVGFRDALILKPQLAKNIRVITIGTGLMLESNIRHIPKHWEKKKPCEQMNWNAKGRNEVFNDPRFKHMWWLEINWTYEGMFTGPEPRDMLKRLSTYGALGQHMIDVVKKEAWAQYFRVGDTPTVLYVIDPNNNLDDPAQGSWAGQFHKPFPKDRPNYYTDDCGALKWDYHNPCNTWNIHEQVKDAAKGTLEDQRSAMYKALIEKLDALY